MPIFVQHINPHSVTRERVIEARLINRKQRSECERHMPVKWNKCREKSVAWQAQRNQHWNVSHKEYPNPDCCLEVNGQNNQVQLTQKCGCLCPTTPDQAGGHHNSGQELKTSNHNLEHLCISWSCGDGDLKIWFLWLRLHRILWNCCKHETPRATLYCPQKLLQP